MICSRNSAIVCLTVQQLRLVDDAKLLYLANFSQLRIPESIISQYLTHQVVQRNIFLACNKFMSGPKAGKQFESCAISADDQF